MFLLAAFFCFCVHAGEIRVGQARFSLLTDRMIRCEWSEDGTFEDRASFTFVTREMPNVQCSWRQKGNGVEILTGKMHLLWTGGAFSETNLIVNDVAVLSPDVGNLLGTTRTLDQVTGFSDLLPRMEKGLLSRRGVTVVDDTKTPLLEKTKDHWQFWVAERPKKADGTYRDLTVFAYGHSYKECLADYVKVAGKIPLPPRWAFGYWWSRYWLYTNQEIRALIDEMKSVGIPIDVFILDMEWHETWDIGNRPDRKDEFGQLWGWTGYTWNRRLFPDPESTLDYLHGKGCKVALNLHPAGGIQPVETCYAGFASNYGWSGTNAIPYRATDPRWADCYFKDALGPLEKQGVDFWWLDWQQWVMSKYLPSVNNTFWLNHIFAAHMAERNGGVERPLIYHRWGGLGSHRYQVGFSGDSKVSWGMLEAIPWFTATASNVGYGYWGHDIGGHCHAENGDGLDGELYLRWLQSGVFTPIFKTHSTKMPTIERRIWKYPNHMFQLREALKLRYRLAPYIYTAAREAHDSGLSLCRPMYYDSPEDESAYAVTNAYMFGSDILASTISRPVDPASGKVKHTVWFPKGRWFDVSKGLLVEGGGSQTFAYSVSENPWYVRSGAIIPMYPDSVDNLAHVNTEDLVLFFAPGDSVGYCRIYEDDGVCSDYEKRGTWTFVRRDGGKIVISPRKGSYELRFPILTPPISVRVNGESVSWAFDEKEFTVVIRTPYQSGIDQTVVEIDLPEDDDLLPTGLNGLKGLQLELDELTEMFKPLLNKVHWAANLPDSWQVVWQTPAQMAAHPKDIRQLLERRKQALEQFVTESLPRIREKLPEDFVRRLESFSFSMDGLSRKNTSR